MSNPVDLPHLSPENRQLALGMEIGGPALRFERNRLVSQPAQVQHHVLSCGLWLAMLAYGVGGTSRAGDLAPASPDEPRAKTLSIERAAGYLDQVALDWTRARK